MRTMIDQHLNLNSAKNSYFVKREVADRTQVVIVIAITISIVKTVVATKMTLY
jgi:hypothetical protein